MYFIITSTELVITVPSSALTIALKAGEKRVYFEGAKQQADCIKKTQGQVVLGSVTFPQMSFETKTGRKQFHLLLGFAH